MESHCPLEMGPLPNTMTSVSDSPATSVAFIKLPAFISLAELPSTPLTTASKSTIPLEIAESCSELQCPPVSARCCNWPSERAGPLMWPRALPPWNPICGEVRVWPPPMELAALSLFHTCQHVLPSCKLPASGCPKSLDCHPDVSPHASWAPHVSACHLWSSRKSRRWILQARPWNALQCCLARSEWKRDRASSPWLLSPWQSNRCLLASGSLETKPYQTKTANKQRRANPRMWRWNKDLRVLKGTIYKHQNTKHKHVTDPPIIQKQPWYLPTVWSFHLLPCAARPKHIHLMRLPGIRGTGHTI